ncbi:MULTISPECIES: glycosyltransferase [unclassified Rhizobium]|uniref:glycosyltransferase n=1 Tax=unclassified Rhizobium TaxID=2613769 RepID=UPI00382FA744
MSRLLLHAPNVHVGGGLSLLRAMLRVRPSPFAIAQLDERARGKLDVPAGLETDYVAKSFGGRLKAEWRLRRISRSGDVILCFNNLPPLFDIRGKSVVFVQNRLLVESYGLRDYPLFVRARIGLERLWLRGRRHQASRYVVQSRSMALMLRRLVGADKLISIVPFTEEDQMAARPDRDGAVWRFDFIYAAGGDPHKNHAVLLEAWRLLARSGLRPSLCLTVDPARHTALASAIDAAVRDDGLAITNAGWLSASELQRAYAESGALIYPSLVESFGLPLLEAHQARLPILAPERDYVRDVADPVETFDPTSALSIARAVKRYLKQPEEPVVVSSASDFLADILS